MWTEPGYDPTNSRGGEGSIQIRIYSMKTEINWENLDLPSSQQFPQGEYLHFPYNSKLLLWQKAKGIAGIAREFTFFTHGVKNSSNWDSMLYTHILDVF